MQNVRQLSAHYLDNDAMTKTDQNERPPADMSRRAFIVAGLTALASLAFDTPASAKRRRRRRGRNRVIRRRAIRRFRRRGGAIENHARQAVRQGEIRPLREVMAVVRRRSNAEVLDVDLHKRPGGWIYALRILTRRGRVRDVFLDARTLQVLRIGTGGNGGNGGVPLPPGLEEPSLRPFEPQPPQPPLLPRSSVSPLSPSGPRPLLAPKRLPRPLN